MTRRSRFHRSRSARLRRDQTGMVLLFWAFAFLGLLAFFAIVADTGLAMVERRDLQNVADASALAGAAPSTRKAPLPRKPKRPSTRATAIAAWTRTSPASTPAR